MQDHPKKPARPSKETTIGVTAFKARCLELIDDVALGKLDRVVLTKRGKAVAEVTACGAAATKPFESSYGALAGMVVVRDDVDLTVPIGDIECDAEKGIAYWADQNTPVFWDDPVFASGHLRRDLVEQPLKTRKSKR